MTWVQKRLLREEELKLVQEILVLIRPPNSLMVALSFAAGWLWAAPASAGLYLGAALTALVHTVGTIRHDIVDREVDRINAPSRPLVSGRIPLAAAQALELGCLLMALAVGLIGGWKFLVGGALLYVVGWLYNQPPCLGSHRPWASIALLALYFAAVPWLLGVWAGGGTFDVLELSAILGVSLSRAATSLFKDFKDVTGDRAVGKLTFLLHHGPRTTMRLAFVLAPLGAALLISATAQSKGFGWWAWPTAVCVTMGVLLRGYALRQVEPDPGLPGAIFANELRIQLALILWLVWGE